jgi:hypothetical protein
MQIGMCEGYVEPCGAPGPMNVSLGPTGEPQTHIHNQDHQSGPGRGGTGGVWGVAEAPGARRRAEPGPETGALSLGHVQFLGLEAGGWAQAAGAGQTEPFSGWALRDRAQPGAVGG